jgi:CxxC-x17-CxxC domain-containing protein
MYKSYRQADKSRNFKNNSFSQGGGNGGGRRESFKAVCGQCGNDCEVPFKPRQGKPVLCDTCFRSGGDRDDSRSSRSFDKPYRSDRDSSERPSRAPSDNIAKQLSEINAKLDNILDILAEVIEEDGDDEDYEEEK